MSSAVLDSKGGRSRRATAKGAALRARILESALQAVAQRPITEIEVRQVAEFAEISVPRLLYYFPSKDDLLRELFIWSEASLAERRERELASTDDAREQLARFVALYLPTGPDDGSWKVWLDVWLRSPSHADIKRLSQKADSAWEADLHAILSLGCREDVFSCPDPRAFADWYTCLLEGLAVHVLTGRSTRAEVLTMALDRAADSLEANFGHLAGLSAIR